MNKNDGGPAFPSPTGNESQHGQLSVRDYFAAQAMIAVGRAMFSYRFPGYGQPAIVECVAPLATIAEQCFAFADAMLTERTK